MKYAKEVQQKKKKKKRNIFEKGRARWKVRINQNSRIL